MIGVCAASSPDGPPRQRPQGCETNTARLRRRVFTTQAPTIPPAVSPKQPTNMARINLPPLTRTLLASIISFTVLNVILRPEESWVQKAGKPITSVGDGVPYLTIVPGKSVVYPWVFLTATAVEENLLGLIVTGLTVFYGGRYLERAWGSTEFTKFILFVAMIPNILSFLLYLFGYLLTQNAATL